MANRGPRLREHTASGSSYAKIGGRQVWFGRYDLKETHDKFRLFIVGWIKDGRPSLIKDVPRDRLLVRDVAARFLEHSETWYRRADGTPTGETRNIELALRPLLRMFGGTKASEFRIGALKSIRERLEKSGKRRTTVNAYVSRISRMFAWAADEDLVAPEAWASLRGLRRLKRGRCKAPEPKPIGPVTWEQVESVLPFLTDVVRAMVLLQWFTAMRPGEVCRLNLAEIDRSGPVWKYRPKHHKCAHQGKEKLIAFGPDAQPILKPFLDRVPLRPTEPTFAPSKGPHARDGRGFSTGAYARAIRNGLRAQQHAITTAGGKEVVELWGPNRLRHAALTRLDRVAGRDAARAVAGHTSQTTTERYIEEDHRKALEVMALHG